MNRRIRLVLLWSGLMLLLATVSTAGAQTGSFTIVSVSSSEEWGNSTSFFDASEQSISADGRYIAFLSGATNLVPGDTNGQTDVFVRDVWAGETVRASVSTAGVQGTGWPAAEPSISRDGRYVVFQSTASTLVPTDTNAYADVFVRDLLAGTTERVSVSSTGAQSNLNSRSGCLSGDGRYVVFESIATNLVIGDTANWDIFLRDRQQGTTTRLSVTPTGAQANGASYQAAISPDGRFVVFESDATNLVTGDTNGQRDIFIRDLNSGQTERVSLVSDGSQSNGHSWYPAVSDDGRYIAFQSQATNLVPGDTNGQIDIFVRDRTLGQTVRVSVSTEGTQANARSEAVAISADGRYVAFHSAATNLVPVYSNLYHIYLRDLVTGTTSRISATADGTPAGGGSFRPSMAPDGRYVVFESSSTNLVPGDANSTSDVFLFDRGADPDQIIPLALDEVHTERLSPGQTTLYSIDIDTVEGVLLVQLRPLSGIDALDLSARLGMVVLVGRYDQRVLYPNADGIYELVIDPTAADTYYLCVKGTGVAPVGGLYEIEAQVVVRHLSDFQPRAAGNAGRTTLNIRGAGLDQAVEVRLQGNGLPTTVGADLTVASPTEIWAGFDLTGVPAGAYDVAVAFADDEVLAFSGTFSITSGAGGKLETRLVVPDMTRTNRTYTLWVEYANVGDADLPAPLLVVSTSPALQIRTEHRLGWVNGTIHLLGVNPSEPAGILPPGAQGRIALLVQTPSEARNLTTSLQILETAPGPIDWNVYAPSLRPDAMTQTEWDILWPALHARLGDTWLEYVTALGGNATRLRSRGVDVYDVRQLLAFEIMRAAGEPIAATTGRAFDAGTQIPIAATRIIARRQDGLVVRADQSGQWGGFAIAYLPDGVYDLVAEGYIITPTVTVTVTQATDANGVRLHATPIPRDQEPDPPLVQYSGPQVLNVEGTPHLVFSVDGQIYHTTYTSTTWTAATPISGAWGTAPRLLYAPDLLDGTNPGLALFWRAGEGNEAAIHYAAARQDGLGGWEWSEHAVYSDSVDAGSADPVAVVDSDGTPLVVWQMMDYGDPTADTDLYYGHEPMASTVLSWDQIAALLVLDREANLNNGTVLPPGAVVALMRSGEAVVIASSAQEWEQEISLNFEFEKKGMVPRYVPYIGGKNIVKFSAALAGTADEEEAEVSGSLGGEVSIMQERVTGSVEGQVSAHWALDKRECVFNLDKGTLTTSLGLTGKFPIPQLTWEDEIFHIVKTEVGVQVGGTLTGELVWTAQGGAWPDGKVTGLISLGFYGEVEFMGAVEGAVTGLGNLEATISATGFEVSDIYFQAQASAQAGALKYELTWRYPPEEEGMTLSHGATLEEAVYAALEDGMQVSTTVSLAAKPGTTTVYSASAVLSDVGADRVDDGAPELVQGSDGLTYLFWHRESGDLGITLGNTLTYATYDGAAWSARRTLTGTLGFGREPAAAPDGTGALLVAWVHADATGWTLASDPNALVDAYDNAQVRYAVMQPGGAWSTPAPITTTLGAFRDLTLAAQSGQGVWATWLRTDATAPALYAAFWNGSTWSTPQVVASGDVQGHAAALTTGGDATLIWAQGTDDPTLNYSQAAQLYAATYDGAVWSAPVTLTLELLASPLLQAQGALATQAGASSYFALPITVPPELCEEVSPDKPNPDGFEEPEEPALSPDPPDPVLDFVDQHTTVVVRPIDPNEKVGPQGFAAARWIDGKETLGYTVYFENVAAATAPAQQVTITDTLDTDLAWDSLVVTEVAFGNRVLPVPAGKGGTYMLVDVPDYRSTVTKTWQVEIVADLDFATGELTVVLTTLDPVTGELPEDPLAGFLPPNDPAGRGEGRVSFAVTPKPGLADGAQLTNQAQIVFDTETSIWTNTWLNTIGVPYTFSVEVVGEGTVLRDPWEDLLFPGQVVTLTATGDPGWTFVGWGGDAQGTTNPLTLTIQANTAITATFETADKYVYLPLALHGFGD